MEGAQRRRRGVTRQELRLEQQGCCPQCAASEGAFALLPHSTAAFFCFFSKRETPPRQRAAERARESERGRRRWGGCRARSVDEEAEDGRADSEALVEARAGQEERDKHWQALPEERCDMWRYGVLALSDCVCRECGPRVSSVVGICGAFARLSLSQSKKATSAVPCSTRVLRGFSFIPAVENGIAGYAHTHRSQSEFLCIVPKAFFKHLRGKA